MGGKSSKLLEYKFINRVLNQAVIEYHCLNGFLPTGFAGSGAGAASSVSA
jgi:hypothetical protein